ncbi:zf-TFIIB domain-containing protein [Elusimicrobiota bacterium]
MKCPNCRTAMKEDDYEGVKLDFCGNCSGVWASSEEVAHIVLTQKKTFSPEAQLASMRKHWQAAPPNRRLACPVCDKQMDEFEYLQMGLYLDRCPEDHGVYFDRAELEKMQIMVERTTLGMSDRPSVPKAGPRCCPHCNIELSHRTYEGVNVDECGGCGGMWCDTGELDVIVERREKQFSSDHKASAEAPSAPAAHEAEHPRVLCPICKDLMKRRTFAHDTDIVIDKCAHGIWLDKGEIERVQAYIEGSEDLKETDRKAWGGVLEQTKASLDASRSRAVENMKWSRFGTVNKFLRVIADKVMD